MKDTIFVGYIYYHITRQV